MIKVYRTKPMDWGARWRSKGHLTNTDRRQVYRSEDYRMIRHYLARVKNSTRPICPDLLDAGCGRGEWSMALNHIGFNVTGIDLCRDTIKSLIDFTRPDLIAQYIEFLVRDLCHTEFPDASFDAIIALGTLEHTESGLQGPMQEMHRVLRPGGYLFASVPLHNGYYNRRITQRTPRHGVIGTATDGEFYQWRLTVPDFWQELAKAKFNVEEIRPGNRLSGAMVLLTGTILGRNRRVKRAVGEMLSRCLPNSYIAAMIMGVARKGNANGITPRIP